MITATDLHSINPLAPETLARPHDYWAALRAQAPVKRIQIPGNDRPAFLISRRADVRAAALDPATFSSEVPSDFWRWGDLGPVLQPQLLKEGWGIIHTIASADPPMHGLYRKLVAAMFQASRVKALLPALQAAVDELADAIPCGERFDFMARFAVPLPIAMIADMLGLPKSDRHLVERYTASFIGLVDPTSTADQASAALSVFAEGQHYMNGFLERLATAPDSSILSMVANARDEADVPLSAEQKLSLCYILLAAGNETTRNALALSAYHLALRPELWEALKADRSKVPVFVEEVLRVGTPAVLNPRVVTRDTELAGVAIPKGAIAFILWASANRDEASFERPDEIDLNRPSPRDHQAFGYGIHGCVGAPLARQELVLSVQAWLDRWDTLEFAVDPAAVEYLPLFGFRSFAELSIRVA